MPGICLYMCNRCGFELPAGWGYWFYVENDKGERVRCFHPGEESDVEAVLGENPRIDLVRDRTGFNSHCVCLDCLHQFEADIGVFAGYSSPYDDFFARHLPRPNKPKDAKQCPECKSKRVKAALQLVGKKCPKCKEGVVEEIFTGVRS